MQIETAARKRPKRREYFRNYYRTVRKQKQAACRKKPGGHCYECGNFHDQLFKHRSMPHPVCHFCLRLVIRERGFPEGSRPLPEKAREALVTLAFAVMEKRGGRSRGKAARQIGIEAARLRDFELGHYIPKAHVLARIVQWLGADPAQILDALAEKEETPCRFS